MDVIMPDTLFKQDNIQSLSHDKGTDRADELFDIVKNKFSWFNVDEHRGASEPYVHEILNEEVRRCCATIEYIKPLLNKEVYLAHRIFGMESNTSYLYTTDIMLGDKPSWAHQDMFIIAETNHYEEYKRPCKPEMLAFKEYFFVASPEVLSTLGLDLENLNDDTLFSALVSNNEVVSYRRYTNFDEQSQGVLANWQVIYTLAARKARRMDLVREMYSKGFA